MGIFNFFKKAKNAEIFVNAPCYGFVTSTKKVNDATFSENLIGDGFAITPSQKEFFAPIDGELTLCQGHAFSIRHSSGLEVLVHIGIDTVKLTADESKSPFKYKNVGVGKTIKAGEPIVDVDLAAIKKAKLDTITPVIIINESLGNSKKIVKLVNDQEVNPSVAILQIVDK